MPARLIMLTAGIPVLMTDLSRSGAAFRARDLPASGDDAVLMWGRFEAFGHICRAEHGQCGMTFECPLAEDIVLATRSMDLPPDERERAIEAAKAWVRGHAAVQPDR